MNQTVICDAIRNPIGRGGCVPSNMHTDNLGAIPLRALMKAQYGVDSTGETAENLATEPKIERVTQHRIMAIASQIKGAVRLDGAVTAGNASGVNDGACALLLANEATAAKNGLTPTTRIVGMATQKVPALSGLKLEHMDVIELNEAFSAQGLAVLRMLGPRDDDARVNAWGVAIALGHPLVASGARLATTVVHRLHATGGRYTLRTMCIGVGQGIALDIERVRRALLVVVYGVG